MSHAELVPSAQVSAHLADSIARAAHRARQRGPAPMGLADLLLALLDDARIADLWTGLDRVRLADQLEVLAARPPSLHDDVQGVLAEAERQALEAGSEVTGRTVVAVVLQGSSAAAAVLQSHGWFCGPWSVEPVIPGFDLAEALSDEDLEEAVAIVEDLDDFSEEPKASERAESASLGPEPSDAAAPKQKAEPAEPTGSFERTEPPLQVEAPGAPVEAHDEPEAQEETGSLGPPEDTWTDFTPPPASRSAVPEGGVRSGQLAHDIPERMTVEKKVVVSARLVAGEDPSLTEGMTEAFVHQMLVTKAMTVRLVAPDGGFVVEESAPETQWVFGAPEPDLQDGPAQWGWTVTPTKRGTYRLRMVISARTVNSDGVSADTALPDQLIDVKVTANVRRTALQVGGWATVMVLGGAMAKFGEQIVELFQDWTGM